MNAGTTEGAADGLVGGGQDQAVCLCTRGGSRCRIGKLALKMETDTSIGGLVLLLVLEMPWELGLEANGQLKKATNGSV